MIFSGVVQPEYKQMVKDMNLETEIGPRTRLSLEQYELIHENKLSPEESILTTKREFVLVHVKTNPESKGERRYIYNE